MADIPADIQEHLTRHWASVPDDIKQHVMSLGFNPPTLTQTTPAPGVGAAAMEAGGATAAELFGAPPGLGAALAGAAADVAERRPFSEPRAEQRVIQGQTGQV